MDETEISAYHEAGHAFMAIFVGAQVGMVTIEPDRDDGPQRHAEIRVEWPPGTFSRRQHQEKMILVSLAGPAAEMLYSGDPFHPGLVPEWAADWRSAWEAAAPLIADEKKRLALLEQTSIKVYRLLDQEPNWSALAAIADSLLAHETLEGEEVLEIVQQWLR
ncbi:ATP-dependent metallopeptidase FtsH/Yme1/Tma family protein [Lignipirellula cremea]|uniref:ATP-dependent zinc metalloprotease FtsH n=1 Tax=Lignipirellula cremea TaxID=2528010 RepID=A0A518DYX7_9BACT|nr:hypothetical protein [Lignipirellula cremea]QDU97052.1 ATP-dependent zinc metalloprotease FtsH [Lignipirellula cremea]